MNEGSTGSGDAGHHHWKPVKPVSAMVVGRLVLGLPSAVGLTIIAATCPAVAGFLAARLLAPASTTALTALTWLPFMAFVALIERPWDASLGYDALQERIHQPQPIPPEYVTADFRDARKYLPELHRIALTHSAL